MPDTKCYDCGHESNCNFYCVCHDFYKRCPTCHQKHIQTDHLAPAPEYQSMPGLASRYLEGIKTELNEKGRGRKKYLVFSHMCAEYLEACCGINDHNEGCCCCMLCEDCCCNCCCYYILKGT